MLGGITSFQANANYGTLLIDFDVYFRNFKVEYYSVENIPQFPSKF